MFGLDAAGADALRVRGEASQAEAADIVRFTRVIKAAMDEPQRIRLMEALWEVAWPITNARRMRTRCCANWRR